VALHFAHQWSMRYSPTHVNQPSHADQSDTISRIGRYRGFGVGAGLLSIEILFARQYGNKSEDLP